MKYSILLIVLLSGCSGCFGECEGWAEANKAKAESRITLFNSCMNLAASMPRQSDDDVSDIVSKCDSTSAYQSNQLWR